MGHQTYAHKVLTGRREAMSGLRQYHGISGFPQALREQLRHLRHRPLVHLHLRRPGMAEAARLRGEDRQAIAVIGDGAMTAGMAFEALNNAGDIHDTNLLVILNDNEMSISPPVGALNKHLPRLLSGRLLQRRPPDRQTRPRNLPPPVIELARRTEEHVKGMVMPGTMFEEFGFNYIGPIDGHDLESLIPTLQNLQHPQGPQFLHVITRKGQGYKLAEADPILYHGVSKFDHAAGIATGKDAKGGGKLTYTQVFGDWLCDMAALDKRLVAITPPCAKAPAWSASPTNTPTATTTWGSPSSTPSPSPPASPAKA